MRCYTFLVGPKWPQVIGGQDLNSGISNLESTAKHEGRLAQLVRAPALQAGGPEFESRTAHQYFQ